jgi:predicted ATPase/class 3 adenylate cyclase
LVIPMSSLPTGTVTFLFTDIEGSTKLAQEYAEAWESIRAQHHAILCEAIESNHGYIFQIIGDAFCAAFHTARDGLNAAMDSQRNLQSKDSEGAPIKVRMGIHTGEATIHGDEYHGYLTMSLVQRVMSAGHGGQILLSNAVENLLRGQLPKDISLRDMGEHRFKNIPLAVRVFQVVAPDLQSNFPALRASDVFPNNLPTQLTSFVGREKELADVKKLLQDAHMLTLIGPGGTGKTRLSIRSANESLAQYPDGVWLVELAPILDPLLVPRTTAMAIGLREEPQRPVIDMLCDYLREKKMLIVLDNCEHLVDACAQMTNRILQAAPNARILASSREALGIEGEVPYRVPSLATPNLEHLPSLEKLPKLDSIQLFIERATTVKSDFTLTKDNASFVAQICFRLDGIPLALELAAARMKVLSPEQIASRLDDRFRLLTGGSRTALPRQQTLRAMIDWSYSLLSEPEKALFRRLAVFVGGWTLEAAESVCGEERGGFDVLDLLSRLVDKSLVFVEESTGEIRYHRLETIRQFSREKFFETDEVETIRDCHLAFYVKYAETADEHMRGRARATWVHRLEAEQDNLRAAMEWGLAGNPENALQIAACLVNFWTAGGYSAEGFRWIQKSLERVEKIEGGDGPALRAKALRGLSNLYVSLGDNTNGKRVAEESIALFRQSQDKSGLAYALVVSAHPHEFLGERLQAEAALMESIAIARTEKNAFVLASALNYLTRITLDLHGDIEAAERYADEAIRISQEAGIEYAVMYAHEMKSVIAIHRKNYDEARTLIERALHACQELGAHFNAIVLKSNLAHMERGLGNHVIALDIYRETIVVFRDMGQTGAVAHQLECFGFIAIAQEQNERALQLFAAANTLREKGSTPMTPDEKVYFDEQLRGVRDRLDKTQFNSIWSNGRAMTMEQAIQLALEVGNE